MKSFITKALSTFLSLALIIGQFDVSVMCRLDFYQPQVPQNLLKNE